jgi:steroid 5-alpha reductase family enzyme
VSVLAVTLGVVLAAMLLLWVVSLATHDVSIVDVFWGLGFVLIAAVAAIGGDGYAARKLLVTALTAVWGLRLASYLLWRSWGAGEDYRYQAMRRRHGTRFRWTSLYTVFGLQGVLMWVISLPVQVAQLAPLPSRLTAFDLAGTILWAIGITFEAVGDWQLARFKADPANADRVMDRGLWAYTRHPNYFGDAVVWWGLLLVAAAAPGGVWTAVGPALMTYLLMRLSGVPLVERRLQRTRPAYADYAARTSAFVPWPPRRAKAHEAAR